MSKETEIRIECCDIYNNLKDKSEIIDYLYIAKTQIAELQQQLKEKELLVETLKELRKQDNIIISNYKTDLYGLKKSVEEIKKIKLKPKEKEIYVKGFENCERQCASHIADLTLENKELKEQLEVTEQWRLKILEDGVKCRERDKEKIENLLKQLKEKEIEVAKLKRSLDKILQPTCTYDELREIIVEGEEGTKDWAIKMLNNDLKILPKEIIEKIKEVVPFYASAIGCAKCGNITPDNYIQADTLIERLDAILKDYEETYGQ